MSNLSQEMKARITEQVKKALAGEHMTPEKLMEQTRVLMAFAESRSQIAVFDYERHRASDTVERLKYRMQVIETIAYIKG